LLLFCKLTLPEKYDSYEMYRMCFLYLQLREGQGEAL